MMRSALASLFAIGLSITAAHAQETQGVTDTEVKVGSFGPFAGPAFLFGKIAMNGIDVVFDKVNAEGGVNGRKLVLVREDDDVVPKGQFRQSKKLVSVEKVFALLGRRLFELDALRCGRKSRNRMCPFILNSATSDAITDSRRQEYLYVASDGDYRKQGATRLRAGTQRQEDRRRGDEGRVGSIALRAVHEIRQGKETSPWSRIWNCNRTRRMRRRKP